MMESSTPPIYKPWLRHQNGSSSSLVASGFEIGIPPAKILPGTSSQNDYPNRPLPPLPNEGSREDLETSEEEEEEEAPVHRTILETESLFPLRNYPLERLKDVPTPPSPRSSSHTSPRSTPSAGSARKIRQLTGLDLNIESGLSAKSNANSPYNSDKSSTLSIAESMHSQTGANYDRWDAEPSSGYYLTQRSPGPNTETVWEVYLQPSKYHAPRQLHMNKQTPRALRHAERSNKQKGKLRIEEHVRSQSPSDRVALHDVLYQERQRDDLGYNAGYSGDVKQVLAHPSTYQLKGVELDSLNDLVPNPLSIKSKKSQSVPSPSPSKFGLIQSARESLAYGINELTGSSLKTSLSLGDIPPSTKNASGMKTRQTTPVSPIGYMESDAIVLPPLPLIPSTSDVKGRKSGRQQFENAFFTSPEESASPDGPSELGRISSSQLKTLAGGRSSPLSEELYPTNVAFELRRKVSGRLRTLASGRSSPVAMTKHAVTQNKAIKLDGTEPSMSNKSGFTGLLPSAKLLQKGNEHFHEVIGKAKNAVHIKTADEKRREDLKQKIMVVGVTDQTPDGRVSEWL